MRRGLEIIVHQDPIRGGDPGRPRQIDGWGHTDPRHNEIPIEPLSVVEHDAAIDGDNRAPEPKDDAMLLVDGENARSYLATEPINGLA